MLEVQQSHADGDGGLDDVHREEEPRRGPPELALRKTRGQAGDCGFGQSRQRTENVASAPFLFRAGIRGIARRGSLTQ